MTDITASSLTFVGIGNLASPLGARVRRHPVALELSGVTISQTGPTTGSVDLSTGDYVYQTFKLDPTYARGYNSGEIRIPPICGFQVALNVAANFANVATLDYRLDYYLPPASAVSQVQTVPDTTIDPYTGQSVVDGLGVTTDSEISQVVTINFRDSGLGTTSINEGAAVRTWVTRETPTGWIGLAQGTEVGSPGDGDVWFDMNFDPVNITQIWGHTFRLGIRARVFDPEEDFFLPVDYDPASHIVVVDGEAVQVIPDISPAPLVEGGWYPFTHNGQDFVLYVEEGSGQVYLSVQQGVQGVYCTTPNPYSASDLKAYGTDGVNPIINAGDEASLRFRVMSAAPDGGPDCLGNDIRPVAVPSPPVSLGSTTGSLENAFWLSKPNPSRFAIESLYFDVRDGADPSVIDHFLVDPLTPGVYFHVYYSNDPEPGVDVDSWDGLLWQRVAQTYLLRQRETFALPSPISAKFLKLEFTHLQPRSYSPGSLRLPVIYNKHPKWVVDYYLAIYENRRASDLEAATSVDVTYDALSLAYDYFLDDLHQQSPLPPSALTTAQGQSSVVSLLDQQGQFDESRVDAQTLARIQQSFTPFLSQPFLQGAFGQVLRQYAVPDSTTIDNYPTEIQSIPIADLGEVSSLDREPLILDKKFPVTSFFLTCRHYYKQSVADFDQDRAYFVGLREVAFTREHFEVKFDHPLYIETAGDNVNIERNDLESLPAGPDQVATWQTYNDDTAS